jgi:hypothetical protein
LEIIEEESEDQIVGVAERNVREEEEEENVGVNEEVNFGGEMSEEEEGQNVGVNEEEANVGGEMSEEEVQLLDLVEGNIEEEEEEEAIFVDAVEEIFVAPRRSMRLSVPNPKYFNSDYEN